MKRKLKIRENPRSTPMQIQYQYSSVKNPLSLRRDFPTVDSCGLPVSCDIQTCVSKPRQLRKYFNIINISIHERVFICFEELTLPHLLSRNSLIEMAFWPYIIGDRQQPHLIHNSISSAQRKGKRSKLLCIKSSSY